MSVRVEVLYFASLRDAAGTASEWVDSDAADLAALYAQQQAVHGFGLPLAQLRVAGSRTGAMRRARAARSPSSRR